MKTKLSKSMLNVLVAGGSLWKGGFVPDGLVQIGLLFCFTFVTPTVDADSRMLGLSNDGYGKLLLEGKSYKGAGINYYDGFMRRLVNGTNTTYEAGFQGLREHHVPFIRVPIMAYWPSNNELYFDEVHSGTTKYTGKPNSTYFEYLDEFVACAEKNNVGLVLDFFWLCFTVGDLVDEPANAIGDAGSYTRSFQNKFVQEIVMRYKDSPAVWAWEFGNEYNLWVDIPGRTPGDLGNIVTGKGQPAFRTVDDILHTEDIQPALSNFAYQVRLCDTNRLVITGHAVPRPAAWNIYNSEQWISDTEQQALIITEKHTPFACDGYSAHIYTPENYYGETMTVADNYIEMMARAAAFDYVCYIGEFGAYNTMSDSEQRDYWDETFDDIVDLDVPLSSAWCYDRVGGTGINILSDNTNSWILDEMALATRALNSPAWTNQDIGTVTTVGWTTDNWRNGEKWIRNASGSVFSGSESGHFMSLKDGLAGDGVITARLSSQSNTCEWAKAGLMIRQDMTSNGRDASLMVASYAPSGGRIYFSRRNTPGSNTVSDIGCGVTAPEWLRLRKVGSSFDAYYKATEGADWTQLGSVVSIPGITTDNEIGLFACSQASSGTFVSFGSVDVQSWSTHAIGISATNAKASLDSTNGFYLVGCGSFSSTNDACSYYSIDGGFNQDAEVVVEVTGVDNASEWACAGIMFRDGFGAGAKHVAVVTAPNAPNSGRTYFKRRLVTGDTHEQDLVAGTGSSRWLKLCREGNLFSAYQSADGNTWTQIGSEEFVSMPAHLEIGLVVVSYATSTTRGFFDHLEVRKLDVYSE